MHKWKMTVFTVLIASMLAGHASAQTAPTGAAPAGSGQKLTPEAIDKLLAPIALYPDALIIQIVQCASSPFQVKTVNDWLKKNPELKGTKAQEGAAKEGFDASFIAIVLFPQVLQMLADQPEWTKELGQAFTTQRDAVLESVQNLRQQALKMGNLKTNEQQKVETVAVENGQQVIVIQPANPQVVYVPQYNPQVVYVQQAPPAQTASTSDVAAAGIIGFGLGVIVGAALDDDDHNYYYNCGGWGYARPVCYSGGYGNYYAHREQMARDYYDHRENMAKQRGENQGQRQDSRNENQGQRQDQRDQGQASRSDNQASRQTSRSDNQATRQSSAGQTQAATQQSSRAAASTRAGTQSSSVANQSKSGSGGAFGGFQSGATERASSMRGNSSTAGSSRGGASRGRR